MNSFLRRLIKLEPADAERPLRIIWNDGPDGAVTGQLKAKAEALEAQGFKVMLVGWQGRMDDDAPS